MRLVEEDVAIPEAAIVACPRKNFAPAFMVDCANSECDYYKGLAEVVNHKLAQDNDLRSITDRYRLLCAAPTARRIQIVGGE